MCEFVAKELLKLKAFIFSPDDPFTWASGIKSPVYCDNRITLSYPESRDLIIAEFIKIIKINYPEVEVIAGVATSGIPFASIIASEMNLPLVYVRSKSKVHGIGRKIEGHVSSESKVVVIEDLLSTGMSALNAADDLRNEGCNVLGVTAIFSYGFKVLDENYQKGNMKYVTLTNFDKLKDCAVSINYLDEKYIKEVESWRDEFV